MAYNSAVLWEFEALMVLLIKFETSIYFGYNLCRRRALAEWTYFLGFITIIIYRNLPALGLILETSNGNHYRLTLHLKSWSKNIEGSSIDSYGPTPWRWGLHLNSFLRKWIWCVFNNQSMKWTHFAKAHHIIDVQSSKPV